MRFLTSLTALTLSTLAVAQPTFTGIGDLAGGPVTSYAYGISRDGSTVVGLSLYGTNLGHAVRFQNGVLTSLGDLPGGVDSSTALCTNADGSVTGGEGEGSNGREGIRWDGVIPTGVGGSFSGSFFGSAVNGMSGDGSVMTGVYLVDPNTIRGCVWVDGERSDLPVGPGVARWDIPLAVSTDGSTIVGVVEADNTDYLAGQVRNGEFSVLEDLPGGENYAEANAVNADGTVVVGYGNMIVDTRNRQIATRWVNGVAEPLGYFPATFPLSIALGVSGDGNTVVGYSNTTTGLAAFIWTPSTGMRRLRDVLINEHGLASQIGTMNLLRCTGISDDGQHFCGYGLKDGNNEGWYASIAPASTPCFADFNQDGGVDGQDVEAFFIAFSEGESNADINQDGGVDGQDVEAFFISWEAGGCQ